MSTFKKTIFLSNKQDPKIKGMAIVTLEKNNQNTFGTIKTFNIENKKNYLLGIKHNEKIYKQNIMLDNNKYNFILSNTETLDENIGCVLLNVENNNYTPIIWGSNKSTNFKNQIISDLKTTISKIKEKENNIKKENNINPQISEHKNNTPTPANTIFPSSKHSIENINYQKENSIDYTHTSNHSSHELIDTLNYKKNNTGDLNEEVITPYHNEVAIASNYASLFESTEDEVNFEIEKELNSTTTHKFYEMIKEQLDELFERYPKEEKLESLIDNSKWIKIKNNDNKYYVVGIILDNNDIKYICYGVPGSYNKEPPMELREYSQWLPTDITNPFDNGYWVMYQDADTGENIIIN